MNILFFLIPKSQVAFVLDDATLRQTAEKLIHHNYTAIPVVSRDGRYISTVSEGDLFRFIKDHEEMNYRLAENTPILSVPCEREIQAINYDSKMEDLIELAVGQNYVPVLDDKGIFIGIITRRAILEYFKKLALKNDGESNS
ncbi:MAG: CBS domain-containing protein [Bacilli bacterium]